MAQATVVAEWSFFFLLFLYFALQEKHNLQHSPLHLNDYHLFQPFSFFFFISYQRTRKQCDVKGL